MPEIVALILQAPLAPLREARPDVPEALAAAIARCLAKDPAARYANVAELARALAPFTPDGRRSFERIARVLDLDVKATVTPGSVTQPLAVGTPLPSGSATEDPWTAPPVAKKRPAWLAYVGVAVVLGAVGVGWRVVHATGQPGSSATADTPSPTAAPPSAASPRPALDALPSAVPSAAATAAPSASVAAHPVAAPHPAVSARPTVSASAAPLASAAPADTTPAPTASKRTFILK